MNDSSHKKQSIRRCLFALVVTTLETITGNCLEIHEVTHEVRHVRFRQMSRADVDGYCLRYSNICITTCYDQSQQELLSQTR